MLLNLVDEQGLLPEAAQAFLPRVAVACLAEEGVSPRCQATLLIVDDAGIRALNRQHRAKDSATDVLSFPSVRYAKGKTARDSAQRLAREKDPETGCVELGDIALSIPRALAQADAYGHSSVREVCFLFLHGMLHLLGYDHMELDERAAMRQMEETVMDQTCLSRNLDAGALDLIGRALKAMENAYAPYSRYRVGACACFSDGRLFVGCNVENASFGLTICAERNAVTTAVAEGARHLTAIAIASEGAMPYPCGACRQFLREFAGEEGVQVYVTNGQSIDQTTLEALLPHSFGPESLPG